MIKIEDQKALLDEAIAFVLEGLDELEYNVDDFSLTIKLEELSTGDTVEVNI